MGKGKKPPHVTAPVPKKAVPGKATRLHESEDLIRIRLGRLDLGGPWCLTKATPEALTRILEAVRNFETMKLHACFANGGYPGKDYQARDIPNPGARARLAELRLDDLEQISRLQIGGKGRLYGFRQGVDFWTLWWDPEHEIWPSQK